MKVNSRDQEKILKEYYWHCLYHFLFDDYEKFYPNSFQFLEDLLNWEDSNTCQRRVQDFILCFVDNPISRFFNLQELNGEDLGSERCVEGQLIMRDTLTKMTENTHIRGLRGEMDLITAHFNCIDARSIDPVAGSLKPYFTADSVKAFNRRKAIAVSYLITLNDDNDDLAEIINTLPKMIGDFRYFERIGQDGEPAKTNEESRSYQRKWKLLQFS